ncbi:MAG: hypothetical protein M0P09_01350 [Acholeplasmataceae bacterium]|nr:hypothetical protein [Acholeplasmataceae bacterium]
MRIFDNDPDEYGNQIILARPLTASEEKQIERFSCDYECEYYQGAFERAWINVDLKDAEPLMNYLIALPN